ncbi:MAG: hypothetical protein WAV02_23720 [Stellaceae bacterium]
MSEIKDRKYYLSKAEQCFRLAANSTDKKIAESLKDLGYEFVDQAIALGSDPTTLPALWRRPCSSPDH